MKPYTDWLRSGAKAIWREQEPGYWVLVGALTDAGVETRPGYGHLLPELKEAYDLACSPQRRGLDLKKENERTEE